MIIGLIKTLLMASLLSYCVIAASQEVSKEFYYFGGGGEPEGDSTIFDNELTPIGKFINSSDWKSTISFNGGHAKTEKLIKKKMSKAQNIGSFTKANYNKLIDEMILKIQSGKLKKGDQLMVSINSHGSMNNGEKTHLIASSGKAATNMLSLSGSEAVNLDRLEEVINLASEKGVKLAIIDQSCFSGNLLNIKNDKVCLISATGKDQFSYSKAPTNQLYLDYLISSEENTFTRKFNKQLKKGRNLEDIFLMARSDGIHADFPMISTSEGRTINDMIYDLIVPYLHYNGEAINTSIDNLQRSYLKNDNIPQYACTLENNYNILQDLLLQYEQIEKINDISLGNEFLDLRYALAKYRDYQKNYADLLNQRVQLESKIISIVLEDYAQDKDLWENSTAISLLDFDMTEMIHFMEELKKNEGSSYPKESARALSIYKRRQKISDGIKLKLGSSYPKNIDHLIRFNPLDSQSITLAQNVSVAARKVYTSLYKKMKNNKDSNPCRDFVL
jgi:hypothetical protein